MREARKKFIAESAYLDDRPGAPMRFLAEANLRQIIRHEERYVNAGEARVQLNDRIREIFSGKIFETVPFPGGPFDVPDEVGDGRPKLVVLAYDGVTIGGSVEKVPELIERIYARKGSEGSALRALRNNLAFVVADDARKEEMRRKTDYRLALRELKKPERLIDLAEYQQAKVREMESRSEHELAIAIQQCYRHVFYPSRNRVGASEVDLAHSAIDIHSTSDQPGAGQQQIVRALRDLNKLRLSEDEPDSPTYVRDHTPLKKGQISTLALRGEFRRDPVLPILIGDDVFIRGLKRGIEQGEYVYRRADLLFGPGDPSASIMLDEQSMVFTMVYAKNVGIWPRKKPEEPEQPEPGGKKPGQHIVNPPVEVTLGSFTAEGVLKEALIQLWEQVRANGVETIGVLTIRMFEAGDAFRLLGAVGAVSGAEKQVTITGGYETREGGSFELEFRGPVVDAQPVKEFLEPQLRDASSKKHRSGFPVDLCRRSIHERRRGGEARRTPCPVCERRRICVGYGGGKGVDGAVGENLSDRDARLRAPVRTACAKSRPGRRRIRNLADACGRHAAGDLCAACRGAPGPQPRTGRAPGIEEAFAIRRKAGAERGQQEARLCAN